MAFTYQTTAEEAATALKDHIVGKNIVITGASPKSLGAEAVRVLAPYAKTIIIASRSKARSVQAVEEALKKPLPDNIKIFELDLGSGETIRAAAAQILALNIPLNVIINNAAVPHQTKVVKTKDNFESQFGSNHLGHFLFVYELRQNILSTASTNPPVRIVNVASRAANWGGEIRWDDPHYDLRPEEFNRYSAYAKSKMANILFAVGLTKRYKSKGVQSFSVHPGVINNTNLGSSVPIDELIAFGVVNPDGSPKDPKMVKTIEAGTATTIVAAFDPSIAGHEGSMLDDGVPHNDLAPAFGLDEGNADKLWELSEKAWGIKF